jgi:hypothetical protein
VRERACRATRRIAAVVVLDAALLQRPPRIVDLEDLLVFGWNASHSKQTAPHGEFIRVAVAREAHRAIPIHGSYFSDAAEAAEMEVSINVRQRPRF